MYGLYYEWLHSTNSEEINTLPTNHSIIVTFDCYFNHNTHIWIRVTRSVAHIAQGLGDKIMCASEARLQLLRQ